MLGTNVGTNVYTIQILRKTIVDAFNFMSTNNQ